MHRKKRQGSASGIEVTPAMIEAGVGAYERWCRFADAPLEGKNRKHLTSRELARLTDEAMVAEIVREMFRKGPVELSGV